MIGITIGDPLGIGPEVILKSITKLEKEELKNILLIGSLKIFRLWSEFYSIPIELCEYGDNKGVQVFDIGMSVNNLEISEMECAEISLRSIDKSIELLRSGVITSVANGPVSKERIAKIVNNFVGHTGYYAKAFGVKNYNMAFYSKDMKIVLLTDHIPLKSVPKHITLENLKNTIQNTYKWISQIESKNNIKIGICGLNPHAGEGGKIGTEESIIKEAVKSFDFEIIGPLPPDTAFLEYKRQKFDGMITLYHDQGLIGFKLLHFEDGINVTVGLPFGRTSPDHGTGFNIVGKGIANPTSMLESIKYNLWIESKIKRKG